MPQTAQLCDVQSDLITPALCSGKHAVLQQGGGVVQAGQAWAGISQLGCALRDLGKSLNFCASVSHVYEANNSLKASEVFGRIETTKEATESAIPPSHTPPHNCACDSLPGHSEATAKGSGSSAYIQLLLLKKICFQEQEDTPATQKIKYLGMNL